MTAAQGMVIVERPFTRGHAGFVTVATLPAALPVRAQSVFKYSTSARRSASVSTSVNSWPVFDWLCMRVL